MKIYMLYDEYFLIIWILFPAPTVIKPAVIVTA